MTPSLHGVTFCSRCLWDPVVRSSLTSELDAWGVSFLWIIWTLLLYLCFDCSCPIYGWDLFSGWLTVWPSLDHIMRTVVQMWEAAAGGNGRDGGWGSDVLVSLDSAEAMLSLTCFCPAKWWMVCMDWSPCFPLWLHFELSLMKDGLTDLVLQVGQVYTYWLRVQWPLCHCK